MRFVFAALAAVVFISACAVQPAPLAAPSDYAAEEAKIIAVLERQDVDWNAGDIDGFMRGYWRSPELRFASGGTVTRGWESTNYRYHDRYNTPEKMGRLTTSDHEIVMLAPDAAVVHGRWRLERAADAPSGLYTLVMRKFGDEWLIVSDTTTSAE